MTTTTPTEIHATIVSALACRAHECRRQAASHSMSGKYLAANRAELRAEAKQCDDLRRILPFVAPEALAEALETRA